MITPSHLIFFYFQSFLIGKKQGYSVAQKNIKNSICLFLSFFYPKDEKFCVDRKNLISKIKWGCCNKKFSSASSSAAGHQALSYAVGRLPIVNIAIRNKHCYNLYLGAYLHVALPARLEHGL